MTKNRSKRGIMMDVAVLIVCLAIATSCLASGVFAKFTARTESAAGSRTAAFTVDASLNASQYSVDLADSSTTGEYVLTMSNDSETAVNCTVTVTFNEPVGDFLTAKMKDRTADTDGTVYTFANIMTLEAGEDALETLSLIVDPARYAARQTSAAFDFTVKVTFTQID